ncbi:Eugenol synthase 1 [Glycine max]|nr:Eugenol synthase 1 [Glycine max]
MLFSPALDDAKHCFSRPEMYKENLASTLEAYNHHEFLCYKSHLAWPPRLEAFDADPLPLCVATVWRARKNDIAVKIDLLRGQKSHKVDVTLLPQELDAMENVLPAKNVLLPVSDVNITTLICYLSWNCSKYEEAREEKKLRNQCEDSSDMVAEARREKISERMKILQDLRFLPSNFRVEEDRVNPLPPFQAVLDKKRKIRRKIEAVGIPYTFVSANCFGAYFVNYLLRSYEKKNNITVYGNSDTKAVLNYEEDIAMYTIKVANDPRTCNRVVTYPPSKNIISQNELISLWEQKGGQNFRKEFVAEEEIVNLSEGDLVNFELRENDLEASSLYPDYNYTSIHKLLDIFLANPPTPASAAFE